MDYISLHNISTTKCVTVQHAHQVFLWQLSEIFKLASRLKCFLSLKKKKGQGRVIYWQSNMMWVWHYSKLGLLFL